MLQIKEHSQKLIPYMFQNDVSYILNLIGNDAADINFWWLHKLNDSASQ